MNEFINQITFHQKHYMKFYRKCPNLARTQVEIIFDPKYSVLILF